ncbi:MAG: OsmC family protein [Kaistella sp.]|nr:OsmC family protein [Kaistella sp.]
MTDQNKIHRYEVSVEWTGNKGLGTVNYRDYGREHLISIAHKNDILGSSDPAFRGDSTRHNPEDLLLSSLASCHMLWYLHLCSQEGISVVGYTDHATGMMKETENGSCHFTEVTLNPIVTVSNAGMIEHANQLHTKANEMCFIAKSVNFPVHHKPTAIVE